MRLPGKSVSISLTALAAMLVGSALRSGIVRAGPTEAAGEMLSYASPVELVFSHDGSRLYVLCQQSGEVRVLDASTYLPIKAIAVGHVPRGLSLSASGNRLFVANSWDDTVSVIDTHTLDVIATWPVGSEPTGVAEGPGGRFVFVANRTSDDVAVLDPQTGAEEKRLLAGRGASYLTLAPDGRKLYATHIYPNPGLHRTSPESEITVIDTERAEAVERISLHSIAGVFHVAISRDGRLGAAAELHPKNLVPLAHLEHGGAFVDSLTLLGTDVGRNPVEIPLDELERYAARPFGVVITPDKRRMFVTSGGAEMVTVIDVPRLLAYIHTHRGPYAQDLAASANYVIARITVGHDPRGMALSPDGRRVLVANRLDDTISVIDARSNQVVSTIPLAGSKQLWSLQFGEQTFSEMNGPSQGHTKCSYCHLDARHRQAAGMELTRAREVQSLRRGEQTFYTSRYSFQGQIGCANCHLDSTFDGLSWDLEPDGFGRNIVDNRLIEDVRDTQPYKWNGGNPDVPTECGPRTEKYFWRSENYDDKTLADLTAYINSLPPRPNHRRTSGGLTPAQERGKAIFERGVDAFGKPIPLNNQCSYCHSGPKRNESEIIQRGDENTYR